MTLKERIAAAMTYAAQYPDPEVALGEPVDDPAAVLRDCATALDAAQGEVATLRLERDSWRRASEHDSQESLKLIEEAGDLRAEVTALRARVAQLEASETVAREDLEFNAVLKEKP